MIGVDALAVLLAGVGSGVSLFTITVLGTLVVTLDKTVPFNRMVTVLFVFKVPIVYEPVQLNHVVPPSTEYWGFEIKEVLKLSVIITFVALKLLSLFVTVIEYEIELPAVTEAGPVRETDRSADSLSGVLMVAVLFPKTGSDVVDETEAVFASGERAASKTIPRMSSVYVEFGVNVPMFNGELHVLQLSPPLVEYS